MAQRWAFKEDYIICKFCALKTFGGSEVECLDELMARLRIEGFTSRSRVAVQARVHQCMGIIKYRNLPKKSYVPQQLRDIANLVFMRSQEGSNIGVAIFIEENYDPNEEIIETIAEARVLQAFGKGPEYLTKFLHSIDFNLTFPMMLQKYLDLKGLKPKDVYDAIDMKSDTFSKILCGRNRSVKKENVLRLCIGLRLTLSEAETLMASAGYLFSPAIMTDVVVKACLLHKVYNIMKVDAELCENDAPTLFSLK